MPEKRDQTRLANLIPSHSILFLIFYYPLPLFTEVWETQMFRRLVLDLVLE